MKKITITAAILACGCLFSGCIPNSDVSENLSGGYIYRDEGGDMKEILGVEGREVYGRVLSYDYNDDLIVVAQQPSYHDYRSMIGFYLRDSISKASKQPINEVSEGERIADSLLRTDPYYNKIFQNQVNYWIISNKESKLYGPYNKQQYQKMKVELKVPDNLRLSDED